jgi:hypothetical protein
MNRILISIAVILSLVSCQKTGDGHYGLYNAYGKWEAERTMDNYVDYAQRNGKPPKHRTIEGSVYSWGDLRWEQRLADRISYLESYAAKNGYSRDWYVDNYLSEGESW